MADLDPRIRLHRLRLLRAYLREEPVTEPYECANCGEPGNPGHHWLVEADCYVCYHRPELTEDAPPPPEHR